jgi:protein-tyrosine phosphatase
MPSVLFVCSANMCRSPMAEALFKQMLDNRGNAEGWRVESAGVWSLDGNQASPGAVATMQRKGIDLSGHRARSANLVGIEDFDLILTMERNHEEALRAAYPELAKKIFMLTEMSGRISDIRDPIGGSSADYDDTAGELERLLFDGLEQIEVRVNQQKD